MQRCQCKCDGARRFEHEGCVRLILFEGGVLRFHYFFHLISRRDVYDYNSHIITKGSCLPENPRVVPSLSRAEEKLVNECLNVCCLLSDLLFVLLLL